MKKIFSFAAIAAVVLTGCAKNEVVNVNPDSPDNISLGATTARGTRAVIAKSDALQEGFKVYGVLNGKNIWYGDGTGAVDGSNKHYWDGSKWTFEQPVKWPAADYPMTFYSYYAKSYTGLVMDATATSDLRGTYTVQAKAADQADFLAAKTTASNRPVSSSLSVTFKHILSKVNYGVKIPTGYDAFVKTVGVENVANSRSYNFLTGAWIAPEPLPTACTADYLYFGKLGSESAITSAVTRFIGNSANTPIYNPDLKASMMLMPQDVAAQKWNWTAAAKNLPVNNETYVYTFYRVEKTESPVEKNYIGYEHASSHPNYIGSDAEADGYNGPLYVKIGYPYTLNWESGKGYIYNLAIPGGVILDGNYYDEDGNDTNLPVEGEKGEPIVNDDPYIHLVPVVEDWDNTPGMDLQ